jgi:hypothetical protein
MATLAKVLINQADIKSALGAAPGARPQGGAIVNPDQLSKARQRDDRHHARGAML